MNFKTILNAIVKDIVNRVGKKSGLIGYEQTKKLLNTEHKLDSDSYQYCIRQIVNKLKI